MTQESRGTFLQLPSVFIETCDLPETAQIIYIRLLHKYGYKGCFVGSLGKLSKIVRTAKTTLSRMLRVLDNTMLISIDTAPDENGNENMRVTIGKDQLWRANEQYCNAGVIPTWTLAQNETQQFQNGTDEFQNETRQYQNETQQFQNGTDEFQNGTETSVKTPPYITSNTNNQITDRSNKKAANAAEPTPLFPGQDENKKSKTRSTLKSKLAGLEMFNYDQTATVEAIMQLGDCWRGAPLPTLKRADSDYQKAISAAGTLNQRQRSSKEKGYSLKEIDSAYRFFKRIAPEGKPWLIADDWWIGKNVDLWVIAKNIDKALTSIAKLEAEHGQTPASAPEPAPDPEKTMVLWRIKSHEGRPLDHWWLYKLMTPAEAKEYGYKDILSLDETGRIKRKLRAYAEGKIQLPPEAQAELQPVA